MGKLITNAGQFSYGFAIGAAKPVDDRIVVTELADLQTRDTFGAYVYKGLTVTVLDTDGAGTPSIWTLIDTKPYDVDTAAANPINANNFTQYWIKNGGQSESNLTWVMLDSPTTEETPEEDETPEEETSEPQP